MGLKFVGWNIQLTRKRVECSNGHAADPDQLLERLQALAVTAQSTEMLVNCNSNHGTFHPPVWQDPRQKMRKQDGGKLVSQPTNSQHRALQSTQHWSAILLWTKWINHFCIGQPIESEDDKSKWLQKIPCHKITENLSKFPYFCTFSDKLLHILRMWAMFCLYFGDF